MNPVWYNYVRSEKSNGSNTTVYQPATPAGHTRREYRHAVFGRVNQPCYQLQEVLLKETLAGRRLYYCLLCQY